jgi:hypothetical protein
MKELTQSPQREEHRERGEEKDNAPFAAQGKEARRTLRFAEKLGLTR